MAVETKYTYDFTGRLARGKDLSQEIAATSIPIAVERIDRLGDSLDVVMKDVLIAGDVTILDAAVAAHTGIAPPIPVDRVKIVHTEVEELTLLIHGFSGLATLNDVTNIDYTLTEAREIEGASLFVYDHTPGDKVDIEFWEPTGPSLVKQYGCDVTIPPSGELAEIRGDETSAIPSGFIMRIVYTSVGTTGNQPRVGCNVRWQH